ncbi:hypothetical protein SBOR_7774 [Sclerotinia borealis F-4128]|uniref:Uncharacterized protein n=1 Tax=Sclerotinia borealis (strain F-4128) TaxID=1432307 RepID=W9C509_SCLBF|nr:hypothetical protein SBOR_7774 [Sclerotinia borealis F-4128]
MTQPTAGILNLRLPHEEGIINTTQSWACIWCPERGTFHSVNALWSHTDDKHHDKFPQDPLELPTFQKVIESTSAIRRPLKDQTEQSTLQSELPSHSTLELKNDNTPTMTAADDMPSGGSPPQFRGVPDTLPLRRRGISYLTHVD